METISNSSGKVNTIYVPTNKLNVQESGKNFKKKNMERNKK